MPSFGMDLRNRNAGANDRRHNFFMTTDDIKKRLQSLQEEINSLAELLPDHTDISFGTLYHTEPTDTSKRKRLVIAIREFEGYR